MLHIMRVRIYLYIKCWHVYITDFIVRLLCARAKIIIFNWFFRGAIFTIKIEVEPYFAYKMYTSVQLSPNMPLFLEQRHMHVHNKYNLSAYIQYIYNMRNWYLSRVKLVLKFFFMALIGCVQTEQNSAMKWCFVFFFCIWCNK